MKRSLLNIIILAHLSAGCGTSYQVGVPSGETSIPQAAEKLVGQNVTIVTTDGKKRTGRVRELTFDALVYQPHRSNSLSSLSFSSIAKLETPPSTGAILAGGLVGCLGGMALGSAIHEPKYSVFGGETDFSGPAIGGVLGCGLGGVAVQAMVPGDVYEFPQARADTIANEVP